MNICRRSLKPKNRPVIPRVANGSPATARSLNFHSCCFSSISLHYFPIISWYGLTSQYHTVHACAFRSAAVGRSFLGSLAGFGRKVEGKYGADPEQWWSWRRPVTEATREPWGTRCSRRRRAGTRRAWDCSPPSSWLCYRRRRTECWIWKPWVFVVS